MRKLSPRTPSTPPAPRRVGPACLLFALLFACGPARAQEAGAQNPAAPAPFEIGEDEVLKIDTDMVLVEVTVTDAAGRPARGLRAEDFKLYDDGEERAIAFMNVERKAG